MSSGLDRPNLYFAVYPKSYSMFNDVKKLMVHENYTYKFEGPTIIYALERKKTEEMSCYLQGNFFKFTHVSYIHILSPKWPRQMKFEKG